MVNLPNPTLTLPPRRRPPYAAPRPPGNLAAAFRLITCDAAEAPQRYGGAVAGAVRGDGGPVGAKLLETGLPVLPPVGRVQRSWTGDPDVGVPHLLRRWPTALG